jgi:hypothetical protein
MLPVKQNIMLFFISMVWESSVGNKSLGTQEQNIFFGMESECLKSQVDAIL